MMEKSDVGLIMIVFWDCYVFNKEGNPFRSVLSIFIYLYLEMESNSCVAAVYASTSWSSTVLARVLISLASLTIINNFFKKFFEVF